MNNKNVYPGVIIFIVINNTYENYTKNSNKIIVEGLQEGYNLSKIKTKLWKAIHMMKHNDLSLDDSQFVGLAMLSLIKLKQIDADGEGEGILITGRYKKKKKKKISKSFAVR